MNRYWSFRLRDVSNDRIECTGDKRDVVCIELSVSQDKLPRRRKDSYNNATYLEYEMRCMLNALKHTMIPSTDRKANNSKDNVEVLLGQSQNR
jgi:hypothetical protein